VMAAAVATLKLDEAEAESVQASGALWAFSVKFMLPPQVKSVSAGKSPILSVGLQPPETVNPAIQLLSAVWISSAVAQAGRLTSAGAVATRASGAVILIICMAVEVSSQLSVIVNVLVTCRHPVSTAVASTSV